ncbi:hypothetical protein V6N11_039686 [Hibiscus sabdariffa]|uniref:Uncharacterized protein n=1 Tax=Hibiscus sabdariffa TaxID=183260 RepID=A0ABR2SPF2_9ROSI
MKNVVILTAYGLSGGNTETVSVGAGRGGRCEVAFNDACGGTGKTGWRNMKNVVILTAYGLSRRKHRDRKRRGGAGRTM